MRPTTRVLGIAAVIVLSAVAAHGHQARTYAGRRVADVLRELQSPQLRIIFSSDLVPPALVVKAEPKAANPRDIAQQILAPHGLTLAPGPRGRLLVVTLNRDAPAAPTPPPSAPAPDQSPGPATMTPPPDEIRIEERVEVTDRLESDDAQPNVYTLAPVTIQETAGGLEDVLRALQVLPGAAATNDRDGKLAVRGAGPEHNVIVVDGVQIHNPHRLGEFTSSFLNPATTASVALDASGLDARHGGRLSSVTIIETRDGRRDRRLAVSGSLGLTSGDVLLEGRLPNTATGSWWASARGTYYRAADGSLRRRGAGIRRRAVQGERAADPQHAPHGIRPHRPRNGARARQGTGCRRDRRHRTRAAHRHELGGGVGLAVQRTESAWRDEPLVDAGAAARHDDDAVGVRARPRATTMDRCSSRACPAFQRMVNVSDFAVRHRMIYTPAAGHLLDAGVETHRIAARGVWPNVKQLDLFRGIGPEHGRRARRLLRGRRSERT